jgi:hypothetical protein
VVPDKRRGRYYEELVRFGVPGTEPKSIDAWSLHSSKRGLSDGENQPDEPLLISFRPALVANSLLSRAGEAYDARDRGPNRKSRFKSAFNI